MRGRTRTWILVVVAALVGGLLGGGAVWLAEQRRIDVLEQNAQAASNSRTQLAAARAALREKQRSLAAATAKIRQLESEAASATSLHGTGDATTSGSKGSPRQFAFIRSISVTGSRRRLVADYAQFLTGEAAARAAEKAGEESPPPNDFYIVNESARLRTLDVARYATVRLSTKPGAGAVEKGYTSDVETLADYLASDSEETAGLRVDGFWLTLENGIVTAIKEQFTP